MGFLLTRNPLNVDNVLLWKVQMYFQSEVKLMDERTTMSLDQDLGKALDNARVRLIDKIDIDWDWEAKSAQENATKMLELA